MTITIITLNTPFKENIRGTTALAYHLLKGRADDIRVKVYTFNANQLTDAQIREVQRELDIEMYILTLPKWYRWLFKFHLLSIRVFMRYPFPNYITIPHRVRQKISSEQPDILWVNNEELSRIAKQFPHTHRIQIGSDVESLYYYRMMGLRYVMRDTLNYWKCAMMYRKYARMERDFCCDDNFTYYAVGEADIKHLRQLNPNVHCEFLRHPHYAVAERQEIRFHQPKIRLLIAGQYNLYMQQTADEVLEYIQCTMHNAQYTIRDHYSITFLGKGWERHVESLKGLGFEVDHIKFAPNYLEEIIKHDIQVTPITIGTGTKGKVLDALANGLLVLGTPYAMENIAVEHGDSCIVWETPEQLVNTLLYIPYHIDQYEQMANKGRQRVLKYHNRQDIARELFSKRTCTRR